MSNDSSSSDRPFAAPKGVTHRKWDAHIDALEGICEFYAAQLRNAEDALSAARLEDDEQYVAAIVNLVDQKAPPEHTFEVDIDLGRTAWN